MQQTATYAIPAHEGLATADGFSTVKLAVEYKTVLIRLHLQFIL
jgi:hypothetical protein